MWQIAVGFFALYVLISAKDAWQRIPHRVIYGRVAGPDGISARDLSLTAEPVGVALAVLLPRTHTDRNGDYRFVDLPWWGEYAVYAEDLKAGYSLFSTFPPPPIHVVTFSPEHPEERFDLRLAKRAGFLLLHLTTGKTVSPSPGC
jgi:hypothetical protein